MTRDKEERLRIARLAQAYQDGDLSWVAFMSSVGSGTQDPEAGLLLDLMEQEPTQGGFTNVNPMHFRAWNREVDSLIAWLRR